MTFKKHIPNSITLLNLFCGCIAITFVVQQQFEMAFYFVCLGIFLDFFDGQTLNFEITSTNDWNEFLENVEFLSINTPKTKEYILDTPQFEKMKDGVFIVNTARGGVLNEVTLLDFIESGKIAGAALDVFENEPTPELPLLMNPNLSLSPHLGGNTLDAQEKIGTELALQIIDIKKKL